MTPGAVHIPWYATGLRGDGLAEAVAEIAPVALRYGASAYSVHRSRDDRYKLLQVSHFERKLDWERYWSGPEFTDFRARHSSWYQVPVLYVWHDEIAGGAIAADGHAVAVANGA
jgi:hypothetical protein